MEVLELWISSASDEIFSALGPEGLRFITGLYLVGLLFKILSGVVTLIVNGTETQVDNKWWNKIQSSIIYKIIAWVLDLILRLRIPKSKEKKR